MMAVDEAPLTPAERMRAWRANPTKRARERARQRARVRALHELRRRHPEEFTRIYEIELSKRGTP